MAESGWRGYFDATAASYDAEEYAQPWEEEAAFYLDVLGADDASRRPPGAYGELRRYTRTRRPGTKPVER
jgi:hypothetical protein